MSPITIYRARRIHTQNPNQPVATHVAVREGRILGAGALEDLTGWGSISWMSSLLTRSCCRV